MVYWPYPLEICWMAPLVAAFINFIYYFCIRAADVTVTYLLRIVDPV